MQEYKLAVPDEVNELLEEQCLDMLITPTYFLKQSLKFWLAVNKGQGKVYVIFPGEQLVEVSFS